MKNKSCPNCHSESSQNILESVLRGVIILMILAVVLGMMYWPFGLALAIAAVVFILYGLKKGRHAWYCKDCKHIWQSRGQTT
ncbi:MAG: hypothetical protein OEY89_07250 [Gammaproteobacteria bacterium]|nr:hypothetical protein [Gammaproteobacteria bacterium]